MSEYGIASTGINQTRGTVYDDNDQTVEVVITDYTASTDGARMTAKFRAILVQDKGTPYLELRDWENRPVGHVPFKETR